MSRQMTRRVFVAVGAATVAAIVVARAPHIVTNRDIRNQIYGKLAQAGWRGMRPEITKVRDEDIYVAGPLPVIGGCHVYLAFYGRLARRHEVYNYTTTDPHQSILSVTGTDRKRYPDELKKLRNPTRQDLDRRLEAAGLTKCQPIDS